MDPQKNTNIIKELLYQQSSKEFLVSLDRKKKKRLFIYRMAAMLTLLLLALVGTKMLNTQTEDKHLIAESLYTFPKVTKSRGVVANLSDQYINELMNKEYNTVLQKLKVDALSEQDLYIKANLYYAVDSLQEALNLINQNSWQDAYVQDEINWLTFLIKYQTLESKAELSPYYIKLTDVYKEKAKDIME